MADLFQITPPTIRAEGKDVPPEQIQAGFNSLARQTQNALNTVGSDPTGPAGGDLSGNYPNPTVVAVHAASGTLDGVVIGGTTPAAATVTTLTANTAIAVTSGGTGRNALNANNVIIGEGSSAVNFAAPGTSGQILASNGAAADPSFQTKAALTIASSGANSDITSLSGLTTPLSVAQGGTGRATLTVHGVLIGETTGAINQTAAGTTGQMLLGSTGADPAFGNNPTITGGTVDGAPVGSTTPSTGAFTTLTASSGINSTAIGQTTPAAGSFTTLSASSTVSGTGFTNLFASPPSIGNTAANTGTFTTLSATSTVSGAGFTARFASPGPIGNTAASTGAFTTLSASSTITPSSTAGIVGTTAADNANAGSVGEYITATGTGVSLSNGVSANLTSISLTAGDWDVQANVEFTAAASTVIGQSVTGINTTSATLPATPNRSIISVMQPASQPVSLNAPIQRLSIASTTTVFLVVNCAFTVSTATGTGFIRARRIR